MPVSVPSRAPKAGSRCVGSSRPLARGSSSRNRGASWICRHSSRSRRSSSSYLADDPGLLEHPLPPLSEAFAGSDLEVHRGFVGMPGTDWEGIDDFMSFDDADIDGFDDFHGLEDATRTCSAPPIWRRRRLMGSGSSLARTTSLGGAAASTATKPTPASPRSSGSPGSLASSPSRPGRFPTSNEPFVAGIVAAATGRDAAGARFVLGACAEARDDVAAAERLFRSALDADADYFLALTGGRPLRNGPGRLGRGPRASSSGPGPVRRHRTRLARSAGPPAVGAEGRAETDPCPCGSGRKYKACHLDGPGEIGPVDAAKALLHKFDTWLSQPNMQAIGEDLLAEVGAEAPAGEDAGPVDPMLKDVVSFDRGGLRQFLDVRGALLPAAERALGRTWLVTRRSLFEVQAVNPGTSVTLRDVRSDDRIIEVADRSMSRQVQPLDLLLVRLLPDGLDGVLAIGGVLVPRLQRRYVLDILDSGDGLDLLRWIAEPAPLSRLANTEGEPLQLITVAYRVRDPAATAAALEKKLESRGDGRFDEMVVRHGQELNPRLDHPGWRPRDDRRQLEQARGKTRADAPAGVWKRAAHPARGAGHRGGVRGRPRQGGRVGADRHGCPPRAGAGHGGVHAAAPK